MAKDKEYTQGFEEYIRQGEPPNSLTHAPAPVGAPALPAAMGMDKMLTLGHLQAYLHDSRLIAFFAST